VLLDALYELSGHVGVLDIIAILLGLDLVERRLVAGHRRLVTHSFRRCLVNHLLKVQRYRHSV
jgi:hypothetical protein